MSREKTEASPLPDKGVSVLLIRPLAGIGGSPEGSRSRSTESAMSVDPAGRVGRPKCCSRSTEKSKSVDRGTPSRSTESPKSVDRKRQGGRESATRSTRPPYACRYYPHTPNGYYRETSKGYTDTPLVGIPTHPSGYYRPTLRWYYRQHPKGYYRKRQGGREIPRWT